MKHFAKATICGLVLALAGVCVADADEAATAAPMSLFGTNPAQASHHATVPYRAEMNLPHSDSPDLTPLRASAEGTRGTQQDQAPAGMRATYKRGRDGSFVKTYVAETGTN